MELSPIVSAVTYLLNTYTYFINTISSGNDIVKGMLNVTILGTCAWFVKGLPTRIVFLIRSLFVVSIVMRSEKNLSGDYQYDIVLGWIAKQKTSSINVSRELMFERNDKIQFSPSEGISWFIYNCKLYWYRRTVSYGTEGRHEKLSIYTFGREIGVFESMIKSALPNSENKVNIYDVDDDCPYSRSLWGLDPAGHIKERPEKSIVMSNDTRAVLMGAVEFFINNRAWYDEKYLPYKLTLVLEGPPGTGKTSIIRMLATKLKRDVYQLNINRHGALFGKLLSAVPKGSIVAIEDFDDSPVTHTRGIRDVSSVQTSDKDAFSIGDILNGLDGVVSLDDIIIILTTNRLAIIDNAIVRPGRVDKIIHVGLLENDEIHEYIEMAYGKSSRDYAKHMKFSPRKGCELHSAFISNINSLDGFIKEISDV